MAAARVEVQPSLSGSSGSIRDELQSALNDKSTNFQTAFSFSKSYPNALNPILELDGLGAIGLPLSTRDAEAIKSRAEQAPFGMGERTVVDTTVRDTWELDASKVKFGNPGWNDFVSKAAIEVCKALGVNHSASQPAVQLYKLLLYETGSHFLPHVDTEKADGMFATIIVVLLSEFTGGAAHLSHGELSTSYDCSPQSKLDTTILAWYTDVMHEIKPITSGYRLALSYNLLHTTTSLRPALSTNAPLMNTLNRILSEWNTRKDGPEKLLYSLDHKYSQANLNASALKGSDAQKVALLQLLGQKHGFSLGLANAHYHIRGTSDSEPRSSYGRRGRWGYDNHDNDDDAYVDFADVDERVMIIQHFVKLDGTVIAEKLEYDEEGETIPAKLAEVMESGKWDNQENEGIWGIGLGRWNDVSRFRRLGVTGTWLIDWFVGYRRSVLVIWPASSKYKIAYGHQTGFNQACDDFHTLEGDEQLELADYLLSFPEGVEILCTDAIDGDNLTLWNHAVNTCALTVGIRMMENNTAVGAIQAFGFGRVREGFELMLNSETENAARLSFLGQLEEDLSQDQEQFDVDEIRSWVCSKKEEVLKTLRAPVLEDCQPLLSELSTRSDAASLLENIILPQLLKLGSADFLLSFASMLHNDSRDALAPCKATITPLLSAAISRASFLAPPPPPPPPMASSSEQCPYLAPKATSPILPSAETQKYATACFELKRPEMMQNIVDRIADEAAGLTPDRAQECARTIMLPLVAFYVERMETHSADVPAALFRKLQETTIGFYMEWVAGHVELFGKGVKEEMGKILQGTVVNGNSEVFMSLVVPRLKSIQLPADVARSIAEELCRNRKLFVFPQGYSGLTFDLVIFILAEVYIQCVHPQQPLHVIATLDWCITVGSQALATTFLQRATDENRLTRAYIVDVLVPSLPLLYKWGTKQRLLDKIAPAFRSIAVAFIDRVLGPPPNLSQEFRMQWDVLLAWKCNHCPHGDSDCILVRDFLSRVPGKTRELHKIGAPRRRHLEKQLAIYARGLARWETIGTSPQGLTVHKSETLDSLVTWLASQNVGRGMLDGLRKERRVLEGLLGEELGRVEAALEWTYVGPGEVVTSAGDTAALGSSATAAPGSSAMVHTSSSTTTANGSAPPVTAYSSFTSTGGALLAVAYSTTVPSAATSTTVAYSTTAFTTTSTMASTNASASATTTTASASASATTMHLSSNAATASNSPTITPWTLAAARGSKPVSRPAPDAVQPPEKKRKVNSGGVKDEVIDLT